jgi:hypothetical protein
LFVTKLNAAGSAVVYTTLIGGTGFSDLDTGNDYSRGIAVDAARNAYVTGFTNSVNFPVTDGAFQRTYGGGRYDVFIAKINAAGNGLVYSTYLGGGTGSDDDKGAGIALDNTGNAYVTGLTNSKNFPTANAIQPELSRHPSNDGGIYYSIDAFVAKLNATGSALVYSTYLGGGSPNTGGYSSGSGIVVDTSGNAYVAGHTGALYFPQTHSIPGHEPSRESRVFVTKINAAGSAHVYSTTFGRNIRSVDGLAIDAAGSPYVVGATHGSLATTANAYLRDFAGGGVDAFITKLNVTATAFAYSTYLGGSGVDEPRGVALDREGSAYVTGYTTSPDFPTVDPLPVTASAGPRDAFVTKLNPAGCSLGFSTFLGGSQADEGRALALDTAGNVYVVGETTSTDFPTTTGAHRTSKTTTQPNPFVTRIQATNQSPASGCREDGGDQNDPILPSSSPSPTPGGGGSPPPGSTPAPRVFSFDSVPTANWFDPPTATGFQFTMTDGALFTAVLDFPTGIDSDNTFTVSVQGVVLGQFGPGQPGRVQQLRGAARQPAREWQRRHTIHGQRHQPTGRSRQSDGLPDQARFQPADRELRHASAREWRYLSADSDPATAMSSRDKLRREQSLPADRPGHGRCGQPLR